MSKENIGYHIKNYMGIAVLKKLLIIVTIVLYSRFLNPDEFGVLSLYVSYLPIVVIIITLNLHTAIGRYIFEENRDFSNFLSTSLLLIGLLSVISVILITVNINYLGILLKIPVYTIYMLLIVAIVTVMETIFHQINNFREKSKILLNYYFFKSVTIVTLSIYLILKVFNEDRYYAILVGELIVYIIIGVYLIIFLYVNLEYNIKYDHIKYMVSYSIPLLPYMLGVSLLSQSDRLMITYFYSTYETGLYSIGYNIGIVMVLILNALLNSWNPSYFMNMNNKNYKRVESDSDILFFITSVITILLILFGEMIFKIILHEKYHSGLDIVPVIALGGFAFSLWQIWGRVIGYSKKTYIISLLTIFGIVTNIGLNYMLLDKFGYKIAAWTTFVSYLVMGFGGIIISNIYIKIYNVKLYKKILTFISFTIIVLFLEQKMFAHNTIILFKVTLLLSVLFIFRYRIYSFIKL
jgi:O-antigen/teichoic acid export membrane protein